jgi:energy-coupling factor transporter transmembrane protein EcfT
VSSRRRPAELHLLRLVPGDSPVHRLWAGTKLVAVATLSVVLSLQPTWPAIAVTAGFVAISLVLARIPRGAAPRLPRWFVVGLALGGVLTLRSSQRPIAHVLGTTVSLGGVDEWARLTVLALVILAAAALVSWTTPLAEVAPALSCLGAPLGWLKVPVDEWATTVALSIRCLPLLIDEVRTLAAARRLRQHEDPARGRPWQRWSREPQDLLVAVLVVSLRRAHDLAEAIEARGGLGLVSDSRSGPGRRDAMALVLLAAVAVAAFVA